MEEEKARMIVLLAFLLLVLVSVVVAEWGGARTPEGEIDQAWSEAAV